MKEKIRNLKWRYRIDEITPADHRIGEDILLIKDANGLRANNLIGNPFKLDMSMAIIYDRGEAISKINMKEYHIKAPAVMIMIHGQTIEPISYSEDLQGRAIVMAASFTERLFAGSTDIQAHSLYKSIMSNPIINIEDDQNVFSQYYNLLLNVAMSPHSEFKIQSALHLTLSMFYGYSHMKHNLTASKKGTTRQEEIYTAFIDTLSDNYKTARDIGYYADRLCITAKHLSQVVKGVSGKTALEIIEEYVLTECKALLLSTTMTIREISDELNFPSQSVFGKYFKRLTDLSPKEYRKQASNRQTTR